MNVKFMLNYSPNLSNSDGPNINKATVAIKNDAHVTYLLAITFVSYPMKGEDKA